MQGQRGQQSTCNGEWGVITKMDSGDKHRLGKGHGGDWRDADGRSAKSKYDEGHTILKIHAAM